MLLVLPCAADHAAVVDVRGPARRRCFDRFGPALLALFPFIVMFLVTSVTTLRERTSGTLERLLAMPMGKLDFLVGYALAFGAGRRRAVGARRRRCRVWLLGLDVAGPGLDARRGRGRRRRARHGARAVRVSAFARTEFQAVQFMPLFVIPQILLCGLFVPRDELPPVLEAISRPAAAVLRRRRDAAR